MNNDDKKINQLKNELYSRKKKNFFNRRRELKRKKREKKIKDDWKTDNFDEVVEKKDLYLYEKRGPSLFSIIFIISIIFFISSIFFVFSYLYFNKNTVVTNLDMSVIGPDSIKSGEVANFIIKLENNTKIDYRDIEFLIKLPKSTIDAETKDFIKNKNLIIENNLLSGGQISKKFSIILSGAQGEKKDIEISAFYKAGDFSNIISFKRVYTIEIESAPINIEIDRPNRILSKEPFDLNINILSNSSEILNDLIIIASYPAGFKFLESEPHFIFSSQSKNIFKIKLLEPGEKKSIKIKGFLGGQNNENKYFKVEAGDSIPFRNEIRSIFAKSEAEIAIKNPDLDLIIASSADPSGENPVVYPGSSIKFKIRSKNNLDTPISSLEVKTTLDGDIFNPEYLDAEKGYYNSQDNTILWDKNSNPEMLKLKGKSYLDNEFSLDILDLEKIAGYFKDPELKISAQSKGINFNEEENESKIEEKTEKIIKIGTVVDLEIDTLYDSGPLENIGGSDFVPEKTITRTIAWKIYNSSSDISNVEVRGKLPLYVKYLDNISPKGSYISYNPETREVVWKYKKIDAFIGYRTDPKTVYFQIEITPSANQKGKTIPLLENIEIKAHDNFTETDIFKRKKELLVYIKN